MTSASPSPSTYLPPLPPPSQTRYPSHLGEWGWVEDNEEKLKRWSSFIGIIVAIVGNLLISLALNTQKYAHVRLQRAKERRRKFLRRVRRRLFNSRRNWNGNGNGEPLSPPLFPRGGVDGEEGFMRAPVHSNFSTESGDNDESPPDETSLLLPRSSHSTASKEDDEEEVHPPDHRYLSSPYWWLGLVLMSIGECGNFLAYGFAPASIVSPLGVVALISNCVIAPVMLKEPFRGRDLIGVVVSICGAVIVVWSAEKEEVKLGPGQILEAISQIAFEVYFVITCSLIALFMYLSPKYGRKYIFIDLGLVGLFGGYTVLSTKGISSLLSSSFYRIFTYPIAYPLAIVLVTTAILQVKYVNRALQRFDSTQVIPTQFVLFTISVILGSAILYRDFETVDAERMLKFVSGCSLTFYGVWIISSGRGKAKNPDDESDYESDFDPVVGLERGVVTARRKSRSLFPDGPDITSSSSEDEGEDETSSTRHTLSPLLEERPAAPPQVTRGASSSSLAMTERSMALSDAMHSDLTHAGEPQSSRKNSLTPSHRRSISSLLPGPIVAGSQLKAVVVGSVKKRRDESVGRERSKSLSFVLDLLKGRRGRRSAGGSRGGGGMEG
ncbi:unnamed protein product [Tuber melanosporum]|uniref:(Perigord truffle) hypothetical protein n=1 Tax=Tuber melanosporum (strain Mel28) TaxID=656061 RepID=D5GEL8_TUBMM|nr:uncharacterized protein GSTUM_00006554001 [Tuber melanosporum]CAZ82961.1 unnamed protein product [Tuber melanosporum]